MPLDPTLYLGYIIAAALIVVFPGPDTMLILRYTMGGGRRVGFATLGGVQIGIVGHITAAVLGLSVLIVSVPIAFKAVAIAGAAYLAFLGIQSLRAGSLRLPIGAEADAFAIGHRRAIRDAIITNLLNPKVIMLFVALMPNFVAPGRASVPLQLALLGITLIVINVAWQTGLVLGADRLRRWLVRLSVQRVMALITGIVFIAFAALLLVDHVLTDGQWHKVAS